MTLYKIKKIDGSFTSREYKIKQDKLNFNSIYGEVKNIYVTNFFKNLWKKIFKL